LLLYHFAVVSYNGDIESRMLQIKRTTDRTRTEIRQELDLSIKYEKPQQDAGVFLLSKILLLPRLKVLSY